MHPDNYIAGNFMVTPTQIVPEWYFLRAPMRSFYIRRSNWSTNPLSMDFKPTCSPKREIWRGQQHAGKGRWIQVFMNDKSNQGKITMYLQKISGKLYRPYSRIHATVIWEIIKIGGSFIIDSSQTQLTQSKERFDAKVIITQNINQKKTFFKNISINENRNRNKITINKIQKRQFINKIPLFITGVKKMNVAVKIYSNENLKKEKYLSQALLLMGFFTLFITTKISIIPASLIYAIAYVEFINSILLTIYITYKKIKFIIKYPLDCNPWPYVKGFTVGSAMVHPLVKIVGGTVGGVLAMNYGIQDLRGVNMLEEIGRNYIDDDKSAMETVIIIKNKLKKGYKEFDD